MQGHHWQGPRRLQLLNLEVLSIYKPFLPLPNEKLFRFRYYKTSPPNGFLSRLSLSILWPEYCLSLDRIHKRIVQFARQVVPANHSICPAKCCRYNSLRQGILALILQAFFLGRLNQTRSSRQFPRRRDQNMCFRRAIEYVLF